jgi:hypothetical protein
LYIILESPNTSQSNYSSSYGEDNKEASSNNTPLIKNQEYGLGLRNPALQKGVSELKIGLSISMGARPFEAASR